MTTIFYIICICLWTAAAACSFVSAFDTFCFEENKKRKILLIAKYLFVGVYLIAMTIYVAINVFN